jgi:hypothetical protein
MYIEAGPHYRTGTNSKLMATRKIVSYHIILGPRRMHPHDPLQNRQKIDNLGESQCRMGPVPLQISPSLVRIFAKRCRFRYILRDPCFHLQIVAGSATCTTWSIPASS